MKSNFPLGVLLAVLALMILLSGCGEKKECEMNSDCTALGSCYTAKCTSEGKCQQVPKLNCCGNNKCDAEAGETSCNCAADCGNCTAKGKIKNNVSLSGGKSKIVEAKYARYICEEEQCVIGVSDDDTTRPSMINLFDVSGAFKAEMVSTFDQPFDTKRDSFAARLELKDLNQNVPYGVTIRSVKILSGTELMGEHGLEFNNVLMSVGDKINVNLELSSELQKTIEEDKYIDVQVDYEYTFLDRGNPVVKRASSKMRLSQKITFIKPD